MTYTFQRGETVGLALDLLEGSFASVTAISAAMKPLAPGRTVPDATTPAIALSVASNGTTGWTATLAAAQSAALAPGNYAADARLTVGGGTIITAPVAIRIVEGVSS
jgi:hypothetical protein